VLTNDGSGYTLQLKPPPLFPQQDLTTSACVASDRASLESYGAKAVPHYDGQQATRFAVRVLNNPGNSKRPHLGLELRMREGRNPRFGAATACWVFFPVWTCSEVASGPLTMGICPSALADLSAKSMLDHG